MSRQHGDIVGSEPAIAFPLPAVYVPQGPFFVIRLKTVTCRDLHRYAEAVPTEPRLSHSSAMILQAIASGHVYGYTIMDVTGLASGTVYPALRCLDREELIRSQWEEQAIAEAELHPPRKYYKLTRTGEALLDGSRRRYPLLLKIEAATEDS